MLAALAFVLVSVVGSAAWLPDGLPAAAAWSVAAVIVGAVVGKLAGIVRGRRQAHRIGNELAALVDGRRRSTASR